MKFSADRLPVNSSGPFIHIVRIDVAPEHDEAFNRWYVDVHLPAILGCPGWLTGARYIAIDDGPRYAAVYTIAGDWAYETPEFLAVKGFMEFEAHVSNFMRLRLAPI
ncbi:DUF4286 family protein [Paraburkholderia tuberum]|uniref:DUF4286 domain-containing protein n=1 Tax=Paraburkholderia tuberum TaxID=157910 RepID=A0A1H1KFU9_9BURK|nr:DUF4286 family protein [Paraburkholderia tuberum]SDR61201.1 hypothetical protein SAMN05445850_7611 [Paraburkholderia tuberum]